MDLTEIIKEYFTEFEKNTWSKEHTNAVAMHIKNVLESQNPDELDTADNELTETDDLSFVDNQNLNLNLVDRFFQNKSIQQKKNFLEAIIADDTYDSESLHIDLQKELDNTIKLIEDRKQSYVELLAATDGSVAVPAPQQLIENETYSSIVPLLVKLDSYSKLFNEEKEPSLDALHDGLMDILALDDNKQAHLAIIKYLYKFAKPQGVKKYFSTKFGEIRKSEETRSDSLTDKNINEFENFIQNQQ